MRLRFRFLSSPVPALLALLFGLLLAPVQPGKPSGMEPPPLALPAAEVLVEAQPRPPAPPPESEGSEAPGRTTASLLAARAPGIAPAGPGTPPHARTRHRHAHAPRAPPALPV